MKEKVTIHFRPMFYGFLMLLFAIVATKFVFSGDVVYIVLSLSVLSILIFVLLFTKKVVPLCILLAFFALGTGMYFVGVSTASAKQYDGICHISGRLTDYESGNQHILDEVKINGEGAKNIYITIKSVSNEIEVGDYIEFDSMLKNSHIFSLGNLNSFNIRHNIGYTAQISENDLVIIGRKIKLAESFRISVKKALIIAMGNQNGAAAYAVLFGDKTQVSDNVKEVYKGAGIIHLLTVSGLHVSFLIVALGFVLKKCKAKPWLNFLINFLILLVYAYLCGFAPSVVRAGIMGLVLLFANISGRWYDNLNSLGFAGILILLSNPLYAFDVGFLMSFSCVLGIFLLYPLLNKILSKFLPKSVSKYFAVSLSAQIGILPFAAKMFSSINLLSVFVNLMVVPVFGVLYPVLCVGALLSLIAPFFGFITKICGFGFDFIYFIADKFSSTNLKIDLRPMESYVVFAFFVLLFVLGRFFVTNKKTKTIASVSAACMVALCFGLSFIPSNPDSMVAYYNNYSNYSVLITNSAKESVIIDLGTNQNMYDFAKTCNVSKVDAVFMLKRYTLDYAAFQNVGGDNIIVCGDGQGYSEEICVLKNQPNKIGDFDFCYVAVDGKIVGLEVEFDSTKLFVFSEETATEEVVNFVSERNYDIVIYEGKPVCSNKFSQNTIVVAGFDGENVTTNSNTDGNIAYIISDKNYAWRCLD